MAKSLILEQQPHLVFLNLALDDGLAVDLLDTVRPHCQSLPAVIIIADHIKYAKVAINKDALYFITPPVDLAELQNALQKFARHVYNSQKHLIIKNTQGYHFFLLDEITHIVAENSYCFIHTDNINSSPVLVTKSMKDLTEILPVSFVRVHKSFVVHSKYLSMISTSKKFLELKIKGRQQEVAKIPISASYLSIVKKKLLFVR
ncbi:MAG: LytTR family transcriptional regulator DNA-binding domain-containing protein [Schleiferiaceae bacterium]|nr:LytTR family transcriptional regulator DNA-binding domain-containing protein [Schleiferiaceae bacterium]